MSHGVIVDTQELYLSEDKSLGSDFNSAWQEVRYHDMGSIQMWWTGADALDGILMPQASNDLEHWADLETADNARTVCDTAGSQIYIFSSIEYKYWRIKYTANTTTSGTITILALIKRRR